jgi:hypothetical protein
MRQLFKIDESEKKRILEMHETATRKNYLGEGTPTQPTQRATFHNILKDDGTQSLLSTTLSKIQNMGDFSKFNATKEDGKSMIEALNSTGIKMFYPKQTTPDTPTESSIPLGIPFKPEQVDYAGKKLSRLLNVITVMLVTEVCSSKDAPCTGTFTYPQVRTAIDKLANAREDMAKEIGGQIPSYSEAIETVNTLNKQQNYVPGGDLTDAILKNISYPGFINAAVILLNNKYASM